MEAVFRRYLSAWRDRKLSTIRVSEVQARMNEIGRQNGQTAANHTLTYAKAAINWCIKSGLTKSSNPWLSVSKFKLNPRERFLKPEELKRFFSALQSMVNTDVRDYLYLSLFTGARQANVLSMRWDQIDFELGTWTIPRTKSGDSQTIPLTVNALSILQERSDSQNSEWVFPGPGKTGHLVEPKKAWYGLLETAKIDDLRMHDLRRTLGSYMAMGNQSLHMIGKVLGHKSPTATQIYSRFTHDPVRQAMQKAQNDMFTAAGLKINKQKSSR
jgi:integrase